VVVDPKQKSRLLAKTFSEGCVLQRPAGLAWLSHGLRRGGGLKDALRCPGREAAGRCRFVFRPYAAPANAAGAGVKWGTHCRAMGRALCARRLTQGATRALHCVPSKDGKRSGLTQARAALPSCARPRPVPGHGKPSTAARPRSTQPGQRPTPASREQRPLPQQRRDRAAARQDATAPGYGAPAPGVGGAVRGGVKAPV